MIKFLSNLFDWFNPRSREIAAERAYRERMQRVNEELLDRYSEIMQQRFTRDFYPMNGSLPPNRDGIRPRKKVRR